MTALTAVVALVFSLLNYIQLNHRPSIVIAMPKVIRIQQAAWGTHLYIQASFTTQEKTDVAGVISSVRVEQQSPDIRKPHFYWRGVAEFVQYQNSTEVYYKYSSDPAPMVVAQDKPQHEHLNFTSIGPTFTAGRWYGLFIAERQGQSPLMEPFCIAMTAPEIQTMEANGTRYFTFRNDQLIDETQQSRSSCYEWER